MKPIKTELFDYNSFSLNTSMRVKKWKEFFEENRELCEDNFDALVNVVDLAFEHKTILVEQTTHEFDLSKLFLLQIFNKKLSGTIDIFSASYLLTISIVYGKYPSMMRRSLYTLGLQRKELFSQKKLEEIFCHLFLIYPIPKVLHAKLPYLNSVEMQSVLLLGNGLNIRHCHFCNISVSKKESFIFMNLVDDSFILYNNVILRMLVFSKMLLYENTPKLLNMFLPESTSYISSIHTFAKHIDFWGRTFKLLRSDLSIYIKPALQNFFEIYESFAVDIDYNLDFKGRTVPSLLRVLEKYNQNKILQWAVNKQWEPMSREVQTVVFRRKKFIFREIYTGVDMINEGRVMKNCMGMHTKKCLNRGTRIWTVKQVLKDEILPCFNFETIRWTVINAYGIKNKTLSKFEKSLLKHWGELNFFEVIDLYLVI